MSELLTVRDLASKLKVSTRQVWKLRSSGKLPDSVNISRSVRWRASDIDEWVRLGCPAREEFETSKSGRDDV